MTAIWNSTSPVISHAFLRYYEVWQSAINDGNNTWKFAHKQLRSWPDVLWTKICHSPRCQKTGLKGISVIWLENYLRRPSKFYFLPLIRLEHFNHCCISPPRWLVWEAEHFMNWPVHVLADSALTHELKQRDPIRKPCSLAQQQPAQRCKLQFATWAYVIDGWI